MQFLFEHLEILGMCFMFDHSGRGHLDEETDRCLSPIWATPLSTSSGPGRSTTIVQT